MYKEGPSQVVPEVRNPLAKAGVTRDISSVPQLERSPGEGHGNPPHYSCLENPRQKSLVGYSPCGHKESDTIEAT